MKPKHLILGILLGCALPLHPGKQYFRAKLCQFFFAFALIFLFYNPVKAQQGNNWCFGKYAGLNFKNGTPSLFKSNSRFIRIKDTIASAFSATISDCSGNLLFYACDNKIFNRYNEVMPYGYMNQANNPNYGPLSIKRVPGDSNRYYVFLGIVNGGLYYYIVNMKLDSGRGDVEPNYQGVWLDRHNSSMAIVMQPNDTDFWLVNLVRADTLYAYPVTASGIGKPKKQPIINLGGNYYNIRIRPNHRGDKLAFAGIFNKLTANTGLIYNFNNNLGVVQFPKYFCDTFGLTDVEFSPNDSLLYGTIPYNHSSLVQYNPYVSDINTSAIAVLNSNKLGAYGLQIASNNKIYFTGVDTFKSLGVINFPDKTGTGCNVQSFAVNLRPYVSGYSLPDIYVPIRKIKFQASSAINVCQDSIKFNNSSDSVYFNSFKWYFGDGDSSSSYSPWHSYKKQGKYNVQLVGINTCGAKLYYSDSVMVHFAAHAGFAIDAIDTASKACNNAKITLHNTFQDLSQTYIFDYGDGTAKTKDTFHTYIRPGSYTITQYVSNSNCSATFSKTITILSAPKAKAGDSRTICPGSNIALGSQAVLGHSYNWTSLPLGYTSTVNNPNVSPTLATTYYLKETINTTGCTGIDSVHISMSPLPIVRTNGNQSICPGTRINLGVKPVAGINYNWTSNPAGFGSIISNPSDNPHINTIYYVIGTDYITGCHSLDSAVISINPVPVVKTGASQRICFGKNIILGDSAIAGISYKWSSNPIGFSSTLSNPKVSPIKETEYYLSEIIIATGCSNKDSVQIKINDLPNAIVGKAQSVCTGQNIGIGSASVKGNSYKWTSNPPGFNSAIADPTINPNLSAIYYLTETVTTTGCSKSDSVLITSLPLPTPHAGNPQSICIGKTVTLGRNLDAGDFYTWASNPIGFSTNQITPSASPTVNTTYYVTEYHLETGCSKTDSVTITVGLYPKPVVIGLNSGCARDTLFSFSTPLQPGSKYTWHITGGKLLSGQGSTSIDTRLYTGHDSIKITETSPIGCTGSGYKIFQVSPLPDSVWSLIKHDSIYVFKARDTSEAHYIWTLGDGASSSGYKVSHTYKFLKDTSVKVHLTVYNTTGCTSEYDSIIHFFVPPTPIFNIKLFPNPFQNSTNLQLELEKSAHVQIIVYDAVGRLITSLADGLQGAGTKIYTLDGNKYDLSSGVYLLKILVDDKMYVKAVVKQ